MHYISSLKVLSVKRPLEIVHFHIARHHISSDAAVFACTASFQVEYYSKAGSVDIDDVINLPFDDSCVHMKVTYGSKVRNLIGFALKKIQSGNVKQISWTGQGKAFSKAVSCAQIFTNRVKGLHRATELRYHRVEEHWQPLMQGLEGLTVNRDIPAVTILLSKSPLTLDNNRPAFPRELENLLEKALKETAHRDEDHGRARCYVDDDAHDVVPQHRHRRQPHRHDVTGSNADCVTSRLGGGDSGLAGNGGKQAKNRAKRQEGGEQATEKKTHRFSFKKKSVDVGQHGADSNRAPATGIENGSDGAEKVNIQTGEKHERETKRMGVQDML